MLRILLGIGVGGILFTKKGKELINNLMEKTYETLSEPVKEFNIFKDNKNDNEYNKNDNRDSKHFKNEDRI